MTAKHNGIDEPDNLNNDGKVFSVDDKIQEGIRLYRMKNWSSALKEFLSTDTSGFNYDEKIELAITLDYVIQN